MTQAFPLQGNDEYEGQDGMTLRDYFAAKAMQAYMTGSELSWCSDTYLSAAKVAYLVADAMMEARDE